MYNFFLQTFRSSEPDDSIRLCYSNLLFALIIIVLFEPRRYLARTVSLQWSVTSRSYGDTKQSHLLERDIELAHAAPIFPCFSLPPQHPTYPLLIFFSVDDVPRLNRFSTDRELVFLVPLISRILGGNPTRERAKERGAEVPPDWNFSRNWMSDRERRHVSSLSFYSQARVSNV